MHDHDHTDDPPTSGKLLRSGITIKATADRLTGQLAGADDDPAEVIDFVEVTVSVVSAHPALVNLNAAAIGAHTALRAQLVAPAETMAIGVE